MYHQSRLNYWHHAIRWALPHPPLEDMEQFVDLVKAVVMIVVSGRREEEAGARLDVRCRSFVMVEDPKRGTGGSRHQICLGDVGAGLSVVFCRSLADSRRGLVICHSMQRHMELM